MRKRASFYKNKYASMLVSGTFTMAVVYLMQLCDSIIAGQLYGPDAVAAVNMVAPLIGLSTFIASCVSEGAAILYTRSIGEMDRNRADHVFGMSMIATVALAILMPVLFIVFREPYLHALGTSGDILHYAEEYYLFLPLNTAIMIISVYLEQMVYSDGDARLETLSYAAQIGGNIVLSFLLARYLGMRGIMLGTVFGNLLALFISFLHFLKKANTLHFVFWFSWRDLARCFQYSITDAIVYCLWGFMDYLLVMYISWNYGSSYLAVMAVVYNLIELSLIFDGIGMAIQPLIGVYFGEKNHLMIRRLMKDAIYTAAAEGAAAMFLTFIFAREIAWLFGIKNAAMSAAAVPAVRIVSLTLIAASLFMLETSYYLYIDHIGFSVLSIVLKDGIFSIILPILFSWLFGENGVWIGIAAAPVAGLVVSMAILRLRVGRERFPWLLDLQEVQIYVYDDILSPEALTTAAREIQAQMEKHQYPPETSMKAALFVEEISSTVMERNKHKRILIEYTLLFEKSFVRLVIRDSGVIFDITDPDLHITGLSSFVINCLLNEKNEKGYVTTTGYNRNQIRFDCTFVQD